MSREDKFDMSFGYINLRDNMRHYDEAIKAGLYRGVAYNSPEAFMKRAKVKLDELVMSDKFAEMISEIAVEHADML